MVGTLIYLKQKANNRKAAVTRPTHFGLVLLLALSGCGADYLNNYDTMTLASGDAGNTNRLLQTVDPFNPNSDNTHIEGDGARAVAVVQRYRSGPSGGRDLDCAGGTGNNPVVQGPVAISGSDPNRLDRDHDGIGCER
ncbi:excalibur calcium-binding domain-containing protein [Mesorhizobium sp. WSM4887]|uniref:excalibur calcium-binding domain-containing protein n=1 Tax=Mesorhizobium sp. WSM4887 TaxID=3038543 RepID=UPI0024178F25|nr:excalibur calcium-binding domain-containing protein [Mesorhizobium sp. WSM4887]MDG4886850.1 excalibur calcium-binding domain-containing protein [Mesorhizobium sp. WSM4887]